MAVQIPKVKALQEQATPSVGRLNVNTVDVQRAGAPQGEALNGVMKVGLDITQQYEKEVKKQELAIIDTKSTEVANGYEVKYKTELARISKMDGDTTEHYAKLDEDSRAWESEIQSQYADASPDLHFAIQDKLSRTNGRLYESRSVNQATQATVYDQKVLTEAIKLRQDDMLPSVELVNAKDPASFLPLKSRVDEIIRLRTVSGAKHGLVGIDESTGNKIYSPASLTMMKKDVGDGIENVVKTLNAAGKTEESKMILDQYADYMNADTKAKLLKGKDEADVKKSALTAVAKLGSLDNTSALDAIDDDPSLDVEVKAKAKEIIDTDARHRANARKRDGERAYSTLSDVVNSRQEAGNGFVSVDEFKDSQEYKGFSQYLDEKQRKALEQQIEKPKTSKPDAFIAAMDTVRSGALAGMSAKELQTLTVDLNEADYKVIRGQWLKFNGETDSQERAKSKYMTNRYEKLVTGGANPLYKKNSKGKYTGEAADRKAQDERDLDKIINNLPAGASLQQQQDAVEGFYAERLKTKPVGGWQGLVNRFNGFMNMFDGGKSESTQVVKVEKQSSDTKTPEAPPPSNAASWTSSQWLEDYKKNNNNQVPSSKDDLKAYKAKRLGGR